MFRFDKLTKTDTDLQICYKQPIVEKVISLQKINPSHLFERG
jgi:hypothetical protein